MNEFAAKNRAGENAQLRKRRQDKERFTNWHRAVAEGRLVVLQNNRSRQEQHDQERLGARIKFSTLFRRVSQLWPKVIRISDGYRVRGVRGAYYFPSLFAASSLAEDRAKNWEALDGLMVSTMFSELHAEARRRLEGGRTRERLRVADLDRKALASRLVKNLRAPGWKPVREEFLRHNPDLRVVKQTKEVTPPTDPNAFEPIEPYHRAEKQKTVEVTPATAPDAFEAIGPYHRAAKQTPRRGKPSGR